MVSIETVFDAQAGVTPDLAAKLAHAASQYAATVYLESEHLRLCVDSLIGILSMDLRRGMKIRIMAEGADAAEAVAKIRALLSES